MVLFIKIFKIIASQGFLALSSYLPECYFIKLTMPSSLSKGKTGMRNEAFFDKRTRKMNLTAK